MSVLVQKYSRLDKEQNIAEVTFTINEQKVAIMAFDYNKNETTFKGDIGKVMNFDSEEQKEQFIDHYRMFGKIFIDNGYSVES